MMNEQIEKIKDQRIKQENEAELKKLELLKETIKVSQHFPLFYQVYLNEIIIERP